jgi:uncharacterized protein (TIGR02271 family)
MRRRRTYARRRTTPDWGNAVKNLNKIDAGWDAYGNDGQKIGSIYERREEFLVVQKGVFFPKDLYVPTDAIERADAGERRVYLNVAKDDIESMGWDEPTSTTRSTYDEQSGSATSYDESAGSVRVPVHEESLEARKTTRKAGEVQVGKRVTEREESIDVPVTREEVSLRRVKTDRAATGDERPFAEGGTIRVPITEEAVEVTKTPRVVEELEVTKRPVTETRRVTDTVRREEVDVDGAGVSNREPAGAMRSQRTGYGDERSGANGDYADDGDGFSKDDAAGVAGGGVGAVGGAAVGGAVGGPPGAVVGGVIGAAAGGVAGHEAEDARDDDQD